MAKYGRFLWIYTASIAFLGAVWPIIAHGEPVFSQSAQAGFGITSIQSSKATENDKSGSMLNATYQWQRPFQKNLLFSFAFGGTFVSIQGTGTTSRQAVLQTSLSADQSIKYKLAGGQFQAGIGLTHLIGPGSGLEFTDPSAGAWTVFTGPKLTYDSTLSPLTAHASVATSLNLSSGRANLFMLSIGYKFGFQAPETAQTTQNDSGPISQPIQRPQTQGESQPMPQAEPKQLPHQVPNPTQQPEATKASALATASGSNHTPGLVPESSPISEPVGVSQNSLASTPIANRLRYLFSPRLLLFSLDQKKLVRRSHEFLDDLSFELTLNHKTEWVRVSLNCNIMENCPAIKNELNKRKVPGDQITINVENNMNLPPNTSLQVDVKNLGMMGLFASKERQFLTRQVSLFEPFPLENDRDLERAIIQISKTMKLLNADDLNWKNLLISIPPPASRNEKFLAQLKATARRAHITVDLVESTSTNFVNNFANLTVNNSANKFGAEASALSMPETLLRQLGH